MDEVSSKEWCLVNADGIQQILQHWHTLPRAFVPRFIRVLCLCYLVLIMWNAVRSAMGCIIFNCWIVLFMLILQTVLFSLNLCFCSTVPCECGEERSYREEQHCPFLGRAWSSQRHHPRVWDQVFWKGKNLFTKLCTFVYCPWTSCVFLVPPWTSRTVEVSVLKALVFQFSVLMYTVLNNMYYEIKCTIQQKTHL